MEIENYGLSLIYTSLLSRFGTKHHEEHRRFCANQLPQMKFKQPMQIKMCM